MTDDEELLAEMQSAVRRADASPTGTPLDAPLGPSFEDRVAARIEAEAAARRPAAPSRAPRSRVVRLIPAASVFLAAAAAVLLYIRRAPLVATSLPLPPYSLAVAGGRDEERAARPASSASQEPRAGVRVTAGAPLTFLLRPVTDVPQALTVTVFASRAGGPPLHEAPAAVRVSPTGAVEVRARAGDLAGDAPGEATIVVVVARVDSHADPRALVEASTLPPGALVARTSVQILP